jgi:hypothetical protein
MNQTELLNLLATHADRLIAGSDDAGMMALYSEATAIRPLLLLAHSLGEALVPLRARESFRRELGRQLLATDLSLHTPWRTGLWRRAALLGSLLSLAGVVFLFLRYNRAGILDSSHRL